MYKTEGGGLGIRMESTAELDEEGEPHSGSVHHVIQYIHPQVLMHGTHFELYIHVHVHVQVAK